MILHKRRKVICFFGPDGAGKSTLIRFLTYILKRHGVKVFTAKIGTNHIPARLFEKVFIALGYYVWRPNPLCKLQKRIPKELLEKKCVGFLWAFTNFIGSLIAIIHYVYLRSLCSNIILVEDFIPRIIADYVYALERYIDSYKLFIMIFYRLISKIKPRLIYLIADYETLKKRRGLCVEPYDYIAVQMIVYNSFIKKFSNSITIDTSKTNVIEALRRILTEISLS